MASLLPIIQDLAPLVLPSSIHIASTPPLPLPLPLHPSTPQHPSDRKPTSHPIISGKSSALHVSILHAPPQTSTPIHHHGEQTTLLQIQRGHPSLSSLTGGRVVESLLSPGDFVLVPAWTEFQISNGSLVEGEDVVVVVTGSGKTEGLVELRGWGGGSVKEE